jgi:hypothetical protein
VSDGNAAHGSSASVMEVTKAIEQFYYVFILPFNFFEIQLMRGELTLRCHLHVHAACRRLFSFPLLLCLIQVDDKEKFPSRIDVARMSAG